MFIADLFEKRRNASVNFKLSAYDFVKQYKDDPTAYIHTTDVKKVGIYPKSSDNHDSPLGIYAFRIQDVWDTYIEPYNKSSNPKENRGLSLLPYHGGKYLYVLKSDIDPNFIKNYTESDLEADIAKLKSVLNLSDEMIARFRSAARTNQNYVNIPAGFLWGFTKAIAAGGISEFDEYTYVNTKRWNAILRKIGYDGFNDPGYGLIHGAEATQAVFLTSSAFTVIDLMNTMQKNPDITLGKDTYSVGHVPKTLKIGSFDSVFFHNNSPEKFKRVNVWDINICNISEMRNVRFFAKPSAKININKLVVSLSDRIPGKKTADALISGIGNDTRITINTVVINGNDIYGDQIFFTKLVDNPAIKEFNYNSTRMTELPPNLIAKMDPNVVKKFSIYNPYDKYKK